MHEQAHLSEAFGLTISNSFLTIRKSSHCEESSNEHILTCEGRCEMKAPRQISMTSWLVDKSLLCLEMAFVGSFKTGIETTGLIDIFKV